MRRLLHSRAVDRTMRGAALVVTDRRWAAPLSAAALGFGIFAGVAIGPGTAGTQATGAPQIVELPRSGGEEGQSGGGGGVAASTETAPPPDAGAGAFEAGFVPTAPLAAVPSEAPPPAPAPKPAPAPVGDEEGASKPAGQRFKGTVVHTNPAAGSYALAIEDGELVSVHAPELPQPGTKLSVPLRRLANGTFVEAGDAERDRTRAQSASFRGTVTWAGSIDVPVVDHQYGGSTTGTSSAYTVSGRGASLLVWLDPGAGASELPELGAYVTVTASLDDGLSQQKLKVEPGPPSTYLDLAGIVEEVAPDVAQVVFSADDAGESAAALTLAVPKAIDATKLTLGDSYLATATVEPDGSLTLAGLAGDEHSKGADDPALAQGDLKR